MTTTLEQPPERTNERTNERTPIDICAVLNELGDKCRTKSTFFREAIRAIATHFGAPYAAIRITQSTSSVDERVRSETDDTSIWESAADSALLECQAENMSIARLYGIKGTAQKAALLTVPVCEHARPIGAISIIARCDNARLGQAYLGELAALVSLTALHAISIDSKGTVVPEDDSALKRAVVKATDFESLHELAFAITNSLKNKFACDQVTLGRVENGHIRILSISGLDDIYPKSPGIKHICQAMEECLDLGDAICYQEEDKWSEESVATNHRLHRTWHEETGNAPVVTVPMVVGNQCVAVLAISRPKQASFTAGELASIQATVNPFAPAMLLVARAERGLLRHTRDCIGQAARWLFAPRTYRRKVMVVGLLASVVYFCFASMTYQVTVPSLITAREIRCFAAPFEGTIAACHVDVGDEVTEGQLLYEMDTTDLVLQQDKLDSELAVLRLRVNQALASDDARTASLAGAEMQVVQAQLMLVQHRLAEACVRAPADGIVVSGDLSQRIGEVVPMGEPLLEFVPEGDWSIELLVPETIASDLAVGLKGRFACTARPSESMRCEIVRIRPTSTSRHGKNVFIAHANVEDNPAWMRTGMEGVAHIDAGRRHVWWVALHRMIDYFHMTFWL